MIEIRYIELTPRLEEVARKIPSGAHFADIGTDHGRLPVFLVEHGVTDHIIATDLREGPLDRARQTADRHGVRHRISFRMGDGLDPVAPEETDTIAITGMGGETIAAILAAAPWTSSGDRRFLLQPMTSATDLRRWLSRHGFRLEQETIVREGNTLYIVITAMPGTAPPLTLAEEWCGRQWKGMDSPLRSQYLDRLTARTVKALAGLSRSTRPEDGENQAELELLLQQLSFLKKEWEIWQM